MVSRNYCFTLFCEEKMGIKLVPRWTKLPEEIKYMCWQREICPKTRKLHLQGYMELSKPMRYNAVQEMIGHKVHLEKRKGTQQQAIDYCKKDESREPGTQPFELGEPGVGRGKRTDLDEIRDAIEDGADFDELREINFGATLRYEKGLDRYIDDVKRRTMSAGAWKPRKVTCYIGPTGCGKTRLACETMPNAWIKPNGKWFTGYKGQKDVILDDFAGDIDLTTLLRILDGRAYEVEIKGRTAIWEAENIWITSNLTVEEWYPNGNPQHIEAIKRRLGPVRNGYEEAVQRRLKQVDDYELKTPEK